MFQFFLFVCSSDCCFFVFFVFFIELKQRCAKYFIPGFCLQLFVDRVLNISIIINFEYPASYDGTFTINKKVIDLESGASSQNKQYFIPCGIGLAINPNDKDKYCREWLGIESSSTSDSRSKSKSKSSSNSNCNSKSIIFNTNENIKAIVNDVGDDRIEIVHVLPINDPTNNLDERLKGFQILIVPLNDTGSIDENTINNVANNFTIMFGGDSKKLSAIVARQVVQQQQQQAQQLEQVRQQQEWYTGTNDSNSNSNNIDEQQIMNNLGEAASVVSAVPVAPVVPFGQSSREMSLYLGNGINNCNNSSDLGGVTGVGVDQFVGGQGICSEFERSKLHTFNIDFEQFGQFGQLQFGQGNSDGNGNNLATAGVVSSNPLTNISTCYDSNIGYNNGNIITSSNSYTNGNYTNNDKNKNSNVNNDKNGKNNSNINAYINSYNNLNITNTSMINYNDGTRNVIGIGMESEANNDSFDASNSTHSSIGTYSYNNSHPNSNVFGIGIPQTGTGTSIGIGSGIDSGINNGIDAGSVAENGIGSGGGHGLLFDGMTTGNGTLNTTSVCSESYDETNCDRDSSTSMYGMANWNWNESRFNGGFTGVNNGDLMENRHYNYGDNFAYARETTRETRRGRNEVGYVVQRGSRAQGASRCQRDRPYDCSNNGNGQRRMNWHT